MANFYGLLTDDGLTTGSGDMTVDGSSTAVEFWIEPDTYSVNNLLLTRMLIHYQDNGSWSSEKFGSITNGLTNGVLIKHVDASDNVIDDLLPYQAIKSNAQWSGACYDSKIETVGAGDSFMSVRWSFFKDSGTDGLVLRSGEKFVFTIQDNLTTLVDFFVNIRGRSLDL